VDKTNSLIFTWICGELWLVFGFLADSSAGNDGVVVAKTWTDVVIRVVAVVLSLVETPDNNAFGSAVDESGFPVTLFSVGLMRNDIVCLNCSARLKLLGHRCAQSVFL
jgi:hypothetical protein